MSSAVLGAETPCVLEGPMFVKSSLSIDSTFKGEPRRVQLPPFLDQPMQLYTEVGGEYGLPDSMHKTFATSPCRITTYSDVDGAQADKQETESDASTADTSPYFSEEGLHENTTSTDVSDMAWLGVHAPVTSDLPLPSFSHAASRGWNPQAPAWQPQGLDGIQQLLGGPQIELPPKEPRRHLFGQCKPCAFAWKPEGCQSGLDCKFCHLCPSGEKQRRKKALRQMQRRTGQFQW